MKSCKTMNGIQDFIDGYCDAMFWTEEEILLGNKTISSESDSIVINECIRFFQVNKKHLMKLNDDASQHGHDFWLTRNGHGTGFWDRGYSEDDVKPILKYCEMVKPAYLEVDDDGIVQYFSEWVL